MAIPLPKKSPYLWPVGKGGMVDPERVVAAGLYRSAPINRAAHKAEMEGLLIDLTYGQETVWVIFLDSGHLVLASDPMPVTAVDELDEEELPWEEIQKS